MQALETAADHHDVTILHKAAKQVLRPCVQLVWPSQVPPLMPTFCRLPIIGQLPWLAECTSFTLQSCGNIQLA